MRVPEAQLITDYADLGVSVGYIGNLSRFGDDRQWYVFVAAVPCVSIPVYRDGHGDVRFDTPAVRRRLDRIRATLAKQPEVR